MHLEEAMRVFDTPEWRSVASALVGARGLTVFVIDSSTGGSVFSAGRCGHCPVAADSAASAIEGCFDGASVFAGPPRARACRAGLTAYFAPIACADATLHLAVGGFVSSTRERRKLYEQLIARGVREESARLTVRGMPVLSRREAEEFAALAASVAQVALSARAEKVPAPSPTEEALTWASKAAVPRSRLETALDVAEAMDDPVRVHDRMLALAIELFVARAGSIARLRRGGYLQVVAAQGEGVRPCGAKVRRDGSGWGRALSAAGVDVVAAPAIPTEAGRKAVLAPLVFREAPVGILEIHLPPLATLDASVRHEIEVFARFAALAIVQSERRVLLERSVSDQKRAAKWASALDRVIDAEEVVATLFEALGEGLAFDVAGVVLTGWGRDSLDIAVTRDVTAEEIAALAGEAAGRDFSADPLGCVIHYERGGRVLTAGSSRSSWVLLANPLEVGQHHIGVLFCACVEGTGYTRLDRRFLETVSSHGAAAFERAALLSRIRDDIAGTITALSDSLRRRDTFVDEQFGRSSPSNVAEQAVRIGRTLGLSSEDLARLRAAALFDEAGSRVAVGESGGVVEQIEFINAITPVLLHRHECWNGSGYPMRLAGEDIPVLSRVLAVAEEYCRSSEQALAPRPGAGAAPRPLAFADARAVVEKAAGTRFDPKVVAALVATLDRETVAGATGARGAQSDLADLGSATRPEILA